MDNILIANAEQYLGQYVTTADFGETEVITSSENAIEAYDSAISQGFSDPVLIYIPKEGE